MKSVVYIQDRVELYQGADPVVVVRAEHWSAETVAWIAEQIRNGPHELTVSINKHDQASFGFIATVDQTVHWVNSLKDRDVTSIHAHNRFVHEEVGKFIDRLQWVMDREVVSRTNRHRTLSCREHSLVLGGKTLIMGILNVTPDSFSDGGNFIDIEAAVQRAEQMVAQGADLIDVGGESTRPGSERVPLDLELERVIPVIKALRSEINVPLSVDTYKAEVARRALEEGAHIINDQWGFKADPAMASVVADYKCPVILMHNREYPTGDSLLGEIMNDLCESLELARRAGIDDQQIILDPGIGFAKSYTQNLQTMNVLQQLSYLGYPVLLGTSRKSMVRNALGLPVHEVIEGTAATVAYGIAQGCQMMRVHDVKEIKKTAQMMDAMLGQIE